MPELRFNLGRGYLRLRIQSNDDALKLVILLRHCNSGLFYNKSDPQGLIEAKTLKQFNEITKCLKKEGYLDPTVL